MIGEAVDIYNSHTGESVLYKGQVSGAICGYINHYLILGFHDNTGCITRFNDRLVDEDVYRWFKSFRFAKPKNVELIYNPNIIKFNE